MKRVIRDCRREPAWSWVIEFGNVTGARIGCFEAKRFHLCISVQYRSEDFGRWEAWIGLCNPMNGQAVRDGSCFSERNSGKGRVSRITGPPSLVG